MPAKWKMMAIAICYCCAIHAQTLEGKIMSGDKPVENATVSMLLLRDSSLVKMVISDKDGNFSISHLPEKFLLHVTAVGYKSFYSAVLNFSGSTQLPVIQLQPNEKKLEAINITTARPLMQYKGDKLIINIDAIPSNAGANLLELLAKLPGVLVDPSGTISLKGKSDVMIMIDGKQTYLSGEELLNLLRNTPASGSDQVEIISNPSARYDASATGGIINIKSKKGLKEGWNGSFTLTPGIALYQQEDGKTGNYFTDRNSMNWNYRKSKINFFGNAAYSSNRYFDNFNEQRFFYQGNTSTGSLENKNFYFSPSKYYQLRTGIDYYLNYRNIFGIVVNNTYTTLTSQDSSAALIRNSLGNIDNYMKSFSVNPGSHTFNGNYNINYKHTDAKKNKELTVDASYLLLRNIANVDIQSYFYDAMQNVIGSPLILQQKTDYNFDVYVMQVDYNQPIGNWKMEIGGKVSYAKSNSNQIFERLQGTTYVNDINRTNNILYKENINAAYINGSRKFKKLEVQWGLRAEQTIGQGIQRANDSSFYRNRTDLFPSVFFNYQPSEKYSINLSYSRKISRPSFRNLNPFVFVTDSLYSFQGNPFLLPQFSHDLELNQLIDNKISIGLTYYYAGNIITNIVHDDPVTKVTRTTVDNFNTYHAFIPNADISLKPEKWWNLHVSCAAVFNQFSGIFESSQLILRSSFVYADVQNNFTFSDKYGADLDFGYSTKFLNALIYFQTPFYYNIGVRRKFRRGNFTFTMNNPFLMPERTGYASYGATVFNQVARFASQTYSVSFNFRFGKNTVPAQRAKKNAAAEEQGRL